MKRHILTRACFISFLTASILSSCTIETSSNDYDRVLPKEKLAEVIREFNPAVSPCDTINIAVDKARQCAGTDGVIVAFGSLSFIGELTEAAAANIKEE